MLRYTLSTHDHPFPHWDLFLEQAPTEGLRTWRLLQPPDSETPQSAEALADHRRIYLDYEGPLSGDRGEVHVWRTGTYEWIDNRPDRMELKLSGSGLQGKILLTRLGSVEWEYQYQPVNGAN